MKTFQKLAMAKGRLKHAKTAAAKASARAAVRKFSRKFSGSAKPKAAKRGGAKRGGVKRKHNPSPEALKYQAMRDAQAAGVNVKVKRPPPPRTGIKGAAKGHRKAASAAHRAEMSEHAKRVAAGKKAARTRDRNKKAAMDHKAKPRKAVVAAKTARAKMSPARKPRRAAAKRAAPRGRGVQLSRKQPMGTVRRKPANKVSINKRPQAQPSRLSKSGQRLHGSTANHIVNVNLPNARPAAKRVAKRGFGRISRSVGHSQQLKVSEVKTQVWKAPRTGRRTTVKTTKHYRMPNPAPQDGLMGVVKLTATLAIALVAIDIVDRRIAVAKPGGGMYYGQDAEIRILTKPSVTRMAVPAVIGVGGLVGSSYLMKSYPNLAYVAAGLGLAGLVYAGSKVITYVAMPALLAAPNGDEMNGLAGMGNAYFPLEQKAPQERLKAAIEKQDAAVKPYYPFASQADYDKAVAAGKDGVLPASYRGQLPLPTTEKPPTAGFTGLAGIPRFERLEAAAPVHQLGLGAMVEPTAAPARGQASQHPAFTPISQRPEPTQTGLGCGGGCGGAAPEGGMCRKCSATKAASDAGFDTDGLQPKWSLGADKSPVLTFVSTTPAATTPVMMTAGAQRGPLGSSRRSLPLNLGMPKVKDRSKGNNPFLRN